MRLWLPLLSFGAKLRSSRFPTENPMDTAIRRLFERYEQYFARALAGHADPAEAAALYASDFIAASPLGVVSGKTDDAFLQVMADGYAHYRDIGTQAMLIRNVDVQPINQAHAIARVGWTATYQRKDLPKTVIDFDVHYLVQVRDGNAKVFGWITDDEQAVLKQHGVI